jgi:hypothetical protein
MSDAKTEGQADAVSALETVVDDLDRVCGGFDAARCFDDTWPSAATGAIAGIPGGPKGMAAGAALGGGAAALGSPNCGDGTKSPATLLREGFSQPSQGMPPRQWPQQK